MNLLGLIVKTNLNFAYKLTKANIHILTCEEIIECLYDQNLARVKLG